MFALLAFLVPAAIVGIVVYLLVRMADLARQVRLLQYRLDNLTRNSAGQDEIRLSPGPPERETPEPPPRQAEPDLTVIREEPPPLVLPTPPPGKSRTREEWESFVGGKVLNLVGSVALIIGVGFFLKYAFDKEWISEWVRVLMGAVAGISCLVGAQRTFRRGYQVFSQGLVGAGIGILYLSVYASFNFYTLLPQWFAFILMSAVTVTALIQGALFKSIAVGMLGWLGGYLTPVMLSTGTVNVPGLLTYVALLTVALLSLVVTRRSWSAIHVLTLAGTWGTYYAWHIADYDGTAMAVPLFFVLTYWLLFAGTDAVLRGSGAPYTTADRILTSANTVLGAFMVYIILQPESEWWLGMTFVFMGAALFALHVLSLPRPDPWYTRVLTFLSAALGALALVQWWEGFEAVMALSVYALLIVIAGRSQGLPHLVTVTQWFSVLIVLLLLSTEHAIAFAGDILSFDPLLNERTAAFLVLVIASGASAWHLRDDDSSVRRMFFLSVAAVTFLLLCTVELNDFLRLARSGTAGEELAHRSYQSILFIVLLWAFLGYGALRVGASFSLPPLRICGIVLLAMAALVAAGRGVAYIPTSYYSPVLNVRAGALVTTAGLLLASSRLLEPSSLAGRSGSLRPAAAIGAAILVFVLLTGETIDIYGLQKVMTDASSLSPAEWEEFTDRLDNLRQLTLSGIWMVYSVALMVAGFLRSSRGLRLAAIVLFGVTILKIFLYDLSFLDTLYRMFSFVALGMILIAVSYAYQRYREVLFPPSDSSPQSPQEAP